MPLSLDPKPIGAFIEYTLKPIIDQAIELIELLEKKGLPAKEISKLSIKIYLITTLTGFLRDIIITLIITLCVYQVIHH